MGKAQGSVSLPKGQEIKKTVGLACLVHHLGRVYASLDRCWALIRCIAVKKERETRTDAHRDQSMGIYSTDWEVRCERSICPEKGFFSCRL